MSRTACAARSRRLTGQPALSLCDRLQIACRVVDRPPTGGGNLEAELRELRYEAAANVAPGRATATGHTRNDVAETALYRLAASGGVRALAALQSRRGSIIRPLIDLESAEIRAALAASGISWREDRSNDDRTMARNRIRRDVLPALETVSLAAIRNIGRTARLAAAERDYVDSVASGLIDDDGSIDLRRIQQSHVAVQRAALSLAARRAGVVLGDADIESLRMQTTRGHELRSLPGGRLARRVGARLTFAARPTPDLSPRALPVPGSVAFGRHTISARAESPDGLDPELAGSLVVRAWTPGDRLVGHRTTASRMLQKAGVAGPDRIDFPVIVAEGVVVAIPGVATARESRRSPGIAIGRLPA